MTNSLAPGLYRKPAEPQRAVRQLVRADVAVFIGYTDKGPVGQPVRLRTLNQFEELFGGGPGFLWDGIKGFFECGGDALYVIRLASATAAAGGVILSKTTISWRAQTSFAWSMIDPRRLDGRNLPGAQPWISLFEEIQKTTGVRSPDAGSWGNQLSLRIAQTALVQTETIAGVVLDEGRGLMVHDLTGLEADSVVILSQNCDGQTLSVTLIPKKLDSARQALHFVQPLDQIAIVLGKDTDGNDISETFDLSRPIRIESVEFDFDIYQAGKLEQSLRGLSPNPAHSRAIETIFSSTCRSMVLAPITQIEVDGVWQIDNPQVKAARLSRTDWADADNWPLVGIFDLSGGADGLQDLAVEDYIAALETVFRIKEAALIAAPDLVMQETLALDGVAFTPSIVDCEDLVPPPENYLRGRVTGLNATGQDVNLASVVVDPAGRGKTVRTGPDGSFTLEGLAEGLVTLRLSKSGYVDLEFLAQTSPFISAKQVEIAMIPLTQPRIFGADSILQVQAAMSSSDVVGPYKVAILDVAGPNEELQDIVTWRARLGDLPRAALVGPWLRIPPEAGFVPASCHFCGATAAAERSVGVHRSGANLALRHVEDSALALDDIAHGILNDAHVTSITARRGQGIRAAGVRSLAADSALRYLSTRRILDVLERTLERVLKPIVFEPNNLFTRQAVLLTADSLLNRIWQIGALSGAAPEQAYRVKCDLENNPDESRAAGKLIVDIGVAPTIPLEFIFFRLGHIRDITKVTEAST